MKIKIYGKVGAGKTSIANILIDLLQEVDNITVNDYDINIGMTPAWMDNQDYRDTIEALRKLIPECIRRQNIEIDTTETVR